MKKKIPSAAKIRMTTPQIQPEPRLGGGAIVFTASTCGSAMRIDKIVKSRPF
jgi:hypothetical protein